MEKGKREIRKHCIKPAWRLCTQSAEKSDDASYAQALCSVSLRFASFTKFSCITPPASGILKVYRSPEPAAVTSFRTGAIIMEIKKKNSNIHCSVTQCKHNMVSENYCGLDCICVGTHESNPTVPECTNCDSFVKRCGTEC